MQMTAPEAMRGRVMANMGTITNGVSPLAQAQSGALAAILGPSGAAARPAAATFAVVRSNPALRDYRAEPSTPAGMEAPPGT